MELFKQYTLSEIFMFGIILAISIKGFITFYDWAQERLAKAFNKEYSKKDEKKELQVRLQQNETMIQKLQTNQKATEEAMQKLADKLDMLIDSDRDDIKAYITRQHHYFCYQMGWIDDFSLDCLEKRYSHYRDEGGNSFISGFMNELRNLPKQPPTATQE